MRTCDDIVVGGGVSGLTAALLLGLNGRRVLLVEKAPRIGGSLCRYFRKGIPFDTGFHFTGGLVKNGLMDSMLSALGLRDGIRPVFFDPECANRFVFEQDGRIFDFPYGVEKLSGRLKASFPGEGTAIERYFSLCKSVCDRTVAMDVTRISEPSQAIDEDFRSLQSVLDGLTANDELKAVLCGFCMCYGIRPAEISFANHARMCQALYESIARIDGGGESLICGFRAALESAGVDILTGCSIESCTDVRDKHANRFVLSIGEEISAGRCLFTIHPLEILKALPADKLSRAFVERIHGLEPSAGFFSVFGAVRDKVDPATFGSTIVSLFPMLDVNRMLDSRHSGSTALVVIRSVERTGGEDRGVISAFEPCFRPQVEAWWDTRSGGRPGDYYEYKKAKTKAIVDRIVRFLPEYRGQLDILDSASMLTFRDYLNSPDGSAYGVKQKIGQFNLFGKLPIRNIFVAGQSSILPGIVGAMMSSFIVAKLMLGKDMFEKFIERRMIRR